jgi:hypothetical protein
MSDTNEARFVAVIKSRTNDDGPERRFFGAAYLYKDADGNPITDHSGDQIHTPASQRALEEAFYSYVKEYRAGDHNHEVFDASTMIEGFVVTTEKKAAGLFPADMPEGIYVGFEANDTPAGDRLWADVASGQLAELSIVGEGVHVA